MAGRQKTICEALHQVFVDLTVINSILFVTLTSLNVSTWGEQPTFTELGATLLCHKRLEYNINNDTRRTKGGELNALRNLIVTLSCSGIMGGACLGRWVDRLNIACFVILTSYKPNASALGLLARTHNFTELSNSLHSRHLTWLETKADRTPLVQRR